MTKRVVVCMSGGVDSTVSALLLKQQGYEVHGITYWFWSFPGAPDYAGRTKCCSLDSASLAADEIGISHETIDVSDEFYRFVLQDYIDRYRRGETPNPCGRCNRYLRFGLALNYADREGFDLVATGHHVQVLQADNGYYQLYRGNDPNKDQTYFLYGLTSDILSRFVFPVGKMNKEQVFAIAQEHRLNAASLPESQDLCFAQRGETGFLFDDSDLAPGPIVDTVGNRLGQHHGLPNYTVGQRRGLGVSASHPLYVVSLDSQSNTLVVGKEEELYSTKLVAGNASFVVGEPPVNCNNLAAKIRYRSPKAPCTVQPLSGKRFRVRFSEPQRAVAPGQIVAIYEKDKLLGGGIIEPNR